jgi:hypothetical protein
MTAGGFPWFASKTPALVPGFLLCAEHDRQLGGESLLSSLMAAKD